MRDRPEQILAMALVQLAFFGPFQSGSRALGDPGERWLEGWLLPNTGGFPVAGVFRLECR